MARKSLGYSTIKEARAAIKTIVERYRVGEEFFHPLLQQLFIEQPYWCDPPGPICTKFRWARHTLPTGATTDWWFEAYCEESGWKKAGMNGWKGVSWRKAVELYKFNIITELHEMANARISVITDTHRKMYPLCEHDRCSNHADHVHHCALPRKQIIDNAIAKLSEQDLTEIKQQYDWWNGAQFMLPNNHKFMQVILAEHAFGTLRSLCRKHHNDAHGHQTHGRK